MNQMEQEHSVFERHEKQTIQVTCALIVEQGKLLACRRGATQSNALEWEFPGGKVESGETEEQSLVRELAEELSVGVHLIQKLQAVQYSYPGKKIKLIPFLCQIQSGTLDLKEHDRLMWITPSDYETLNWSAADRLLIETNMQYIMRWV